MRSFEAMGKKPRSRKTMEVDISWLENVPEEEGGKKKKPPRMPGAAVTVPPLPVASSEPPSRNTIPVKDEWVEIVDDDATKKAKAAT